MSKSISIKEFTQELNKEIESQERNLSRSYERHFKETEIMDPDEFAVKRNRDDIIKYKTIIDTLKNVINTLNAHI